MQIDEIQNTVYVRLDAADLTSPAALTAAAVEMEKGHVVNVGIFSMHFNAQSGHTFLLVKGERSEYTCSPEVVLQSVAALRRPDRVLADLAIHAVPEAPPEE